MFLNYMVILITSAVVLNSTGVKVNSLIEMDMQLEFLLSFFAKWLYLVNKDDLNFKNFIDTYILVW